MRFVRTRAFGRRADLHPLSDERGSVGAEAVLAMLVIVPAFVALIVFAQTLDAWLAQNHVAATAARAAAQDGGDSATLRTRIDDDLRRAGIAPEGVQVLVDPATVDWRDPIRVELSSSRRVQRQNVEGMGLWTNHTTFGDDGYFISDGYDFSSTGYHILTTDGARGRDTIGRE